MAIAPLNKERDYNRLFQRAIWLATFAGEGAPTAVR
ncbi:MAG: hypothetical protein QOD64_2435, partial [Verrucomicrobiota bacterium]